MPRARRLAEEVLRRTDPQGFYVIPLRAPGEREKELAKRLAEAYAASLEEVGDTVLLRVKSRSAARRLLEAALRAGLSLEA